MDGPHGFYCVTNCWKQGLPSGVCTDHPGVLLKEPGETDEGLNNSNISHSGRSRSSANEREAIKTSWEILGVTTVGLVSTADARQRDHPKNVRCDLVREKLA